MKRHENRTPASDARLDNRGEAPLYPNPISPRNQTIKTEPNNAMERSRMLVTVRADARPAPSIRLAHLER